MFATFAVWDRGVKAVAGMRPGGLHCPESMDPSCKSIGKKINATTLIGIRGVSTHADKHGMGPKVVHEIPLFESGRPDGVEVPL